MTNIDAMTVRPCRYCGSEVTSKSPDIDYCMFCYYDGTSQREPLAGLIADLDALGTTTSIWHTGGGCFALHIHVDGTSDERYLLATDGNAGLPDTADGPWSVGRYDEDESSDDYEGTYLVGDESGEGEADAAQLLAIVAAHIAAVRS
jgi:hypothetical protein